jgi:hypothetical protein
VDGASYDYTEVYAGLLGQQLQGRLYFSPDYFGRGVRSVYAELDMQWALGRGWRAQAHVGGLAVDEDTGAAYGHPQRQARADVRAGVSHPLGDAEVQLYWSAAQHGGPYPTSYGGNASGWVLSLATFF